MTPVRVLAELEALAARLGVAVRVERLRAASERAGGLCRLRGQPLVVMDDSLAVAERIDVMAAALSEFDLEGLYVPPAVRARVEASRR